MFAELLKYAYIIEFTEKPNYDHIRFMLKKILLDLNQIPSPAFNWKVRHDPKDTILQDVGASSNSVYGIGQFQDTNEFDDLDKLS